MTFNKEWNMECYSINELINIINWGQVINKNALIVSIRLVGKI